MSSSSDQVFPTQPGYLALNPVLAHLPCETPEARAQRVYKWLAGFLIRTDRPVAFVYSTSEDQCQKIVATQNLDSPLDPGLFDGYEEAQFYAELIKILNEKNEAVRQSIITLQQALDDPLHEWNPLSKRAECAALHRSYTSFREKLQAIRLVPIPTSLHGGMDDGPNAVTLPLINQRIHALCAHIQSGAAVFAIPNAHNAARKFAIGDADSLHFRNTPRFDDETTFAMHVERRLHNLMTAAQASDPLYPDEENDTPRVHVLAQRLQHIRTLGNYTDWKYLKADLINQILLASKAEQLQLIRDYGPLLDMHYTFPGITLFRGETDARVKADYILASEGYCLYDAADSALDQLACV